MNKSSRSSRLLSTARGGSDQQLLAENKRLRQQIIHLKNINQSYANLLSKIFQTIYSEASDLNPREKKLANVNNFQNQTIYKLKQQIQMNKQMEAQYLILNNYIKGKPYKSILDFINSFQSLTNEIGSKKQFIKSLQGKLGNMKKQLQDTGQTAKLKKKINQLEQKNVKIEVKCEKLLCQMQQTIKSNNNLRVQSFNTEIKLRELELKEQRSTRLLSRKSSLNVNKENKYQSKTKQKK